MNAVRIAIFAWIFSQTPHRLHRKLPYSAAFPALLQSQLVFLVDKTAKPKTASARVTIIAAQINDNKTMLGIVWCCMCLGIYGDCNGL